MKRVHAHGSIMECRCNNPPEKFGGPTPTPSANLFYGNTYNLRTFSICQCDDTCAKCGEYIPRRARARLAHLLSTLHWVTPSVCECVPCTCEQTPFLYHRNECEVSIAYHKLEEGRHAL